MLDAVNCLDTLKYVLKRVVYRILTSLNSKSLVSHVLKGDYLLTDFVLSQLLSWDMLIFCMIWAVDASIYTIIRQIKWCKKHDSVSVIILLYLTG